jgi:hypothetical protein
MGLSPTVREGSKALLMSSLAVGLISSQEVASVGFSLALD